MVSSKALKTLQKNTQDLDHLLDMHEDLTGQGKGKRGPQANVLNRSGIVLGCAAWEAYLEDVALEACDFLRKKAQSERAIPDGIKASVVDVLREKKNDSNIKYWKLCDDRWWRSQIHEVVIGITKRFQNPSAEKADKLMGKCLGMRNISKSWGKRAGKLDKFVDLRHEIAHGAAAKVVYKKQVQGFRDLLLALGDMVDQQVAQRVEELLSKESTALTQARKKRPGRKPKKSKSRRGRPRKLRPW